MSAVRIQRKRTRGWRMPEGAVYVGRPSVLGNPFDLRYYTLDQSLALYREAALGGWNPTILRGEPDWLIDQAYATTVGWRRRISTRNTAETIRAYLRDATALACWCPLDQPCHADVLLELANR